MVHIWQHFFYPLLNSTFLQTLVTFGVGFVAFFIYRKQHVDEKRNAAQAIYNEVLSAENKLKGIRERFFAVQYPTLEAVQIMEKENWSRYKYLLANDLERAEWDLIDNFYSSCKAYDEAVTLNESYFHEDTKHIFDSIFKHYTKEVNTFYMSNPKKTELPKKTKDAVAAYVSTYIGNVVASGTQYRPQKPVNDARVALVALDTNISLSSAGQKIKAIAKLK